jgi:hypothetical protein
VQRRRDRHNDKQGRASELQSVRSGSRGVSRRQCACKLLRSARSGALPGSLATGASRAASSVAHLVVQLSGTCAGLCHEARAAAQSLTRCMRGNVRAPVGT